MPLALSTVAFSAYDWKPTTANEPAKNIFRTPLFAKAETNSLNRMAKIIKQLTKLLSPIGFYRGRTQPPMTLVFSRAAGATDWQSYRLVPRRQPKAVHYHYHHHEISGGANPTLTVLGESLALVGLSVGLLTLFAGLSSL